MASLVGNGRSTLLERYNGNRTGLYAVVNSMLLGDSACTMGTEVDDVVGEKGDVIQLVSSDG
jgi:hypothetical protein